MAIDSAAKRASIAGFIIPDGALDQGDRQTIAGKYRGILATAAVVSEFMKITLLTATNFIAQELAATNQIEQTLTAGNYIAQVLTVEE